MVENKLGYMALKEVILPSMGEGITEASIIRWLVNEGDPVKFDQPLVEIATDKVDSEIPSPFEGVLKKIICPVGATPQVGEAVALISIPTEDGFKEIDEHVSIHKSDSVTKAPFTPVLRNLPQKKQFNVDDLQNNLPFVPPYVRMVSNKLNINLSNLASFVGKTFGESLTKGDIEQYILSNEIDSQEIELKLSKPIEKEVISTKSALVSYSGPYHIEEMGRVRKRIAERMVLSSNTIPHVTSFIETDVTNMAQWRDKNKELFFAKYHTKLTFTPLFIEAIVHGLKTHPDVNVSIDGSQIIYKESINIGMATLLPDKDLIVPVVKQADTLNLQGLAMAVNDLSTRARSKDLKPEEITGSTFTFTNIGIFGTLAGVPLVNSPEAAILAIGAVNKKPDAVLTDDGYTIGIRDKVMLSLAYDHRIIDGGLGGNFLKTISDYIENFDSQRLI